TLRTVEHSSMDRRLSGQPAGRAGGSKKAAHDRKQFRLLEQERVVPLVGDDLRERDARGTRVERVHDGARLDRRKQPVAGERYHAETRLGAAERLGEYPAIVGGEIEVVHRARQIEVAVGIKTFDE